MWSSRCFKSMLGCAVTAIRQCSTRFRRDRTLTQVRRSRWQWSIDRHGQLVRGIQRLEDRALLSASIASLSVAAQGNEAGPVNIVYSVTLSQPNDSGSVITFDLDDLGAGTATSGSDYAAIPANAQIVVAAGASTGTLTVAVVNDALLEATETLVAQISNPSSATVTIGAASATARIVDNESPNPPPGYSRTVAASGANFRLVNQVIFADSATAYATVGTPGAADGRIMRFDYDVATGTFSNAVQVFDVDAIGDGIPVPIGIGIHDGDLWISRFSGWPAPRPAVVTRLRDTDGDGIFDQHTDFIKGMILALPGETSHTINQIEIHNDSLYVGIGTRTNDGSPAAELQYNGAIVRIPDLNNPVVTDLSDAVYRQGDFLNTTATDGRAHLFARGFRNPYGLRFDTSGQLWVTDNGADAGTDDNGLPFAATPDLIYKNVRAGDIAKFPPPGSPGGGSHTIEPLSSLNFNTAPGGFDFIPSGPDAGALLIGMTSATNGQTVAFLRSDGTGFTLNFFDIGATAIEVIPDALGRMLVFDRDNGIVYQLTNDATFIGNSTNSNPVFTSTATPSVPENTASVLTVTATDADLPAQTITFAIAGGADQEKFSITASGVLSFRAAPDFEIPTDADANNVYHVQVTASDGNGGTTVQNLSVTVTNVVEASPGPTVTLSVSPSTAAEGGGKSIVTATLSAVSTTSTTIALGFSGTATLTSDYTRTATSIVIPAGQLTGIMKLFGVQDSQVEGNETIIVDILTVTNGTENGTQQVTATITDDDSAGPTLPTVTLSVSPSTAAEGGGKSIVTARLSAVSPTSTTIALVFSGTATLTSDYTRTATSIVIPAGQLTGIMKLFGVQDTLVEGNETIIVDILSVTNGTESGVQQVTATIVDDDVAIVQALVAAFDAPFSDSKNAPSNQMPLASQLITPSDGRKNGARILDDFNVSSIPMSLIDEVFAKANSLLFG